MCSEVWVVVWCVSGCGAVVWEQAGGGKCVRVCEVVRLWRDAGASACVGLVRVVLCGVEAAGLAVSVLCECVHASECVFACICACTCDCACASSALYACWSHARCVPAPLLRRALRRSPSRFDRR